MPNDEVLDSMGNPFPHPTDSTDDEFYSWLKKAALGDVSSIHNLLCQCFNQLKEVKDDLVRNLRKDVYAEPEKSEVKKKLSNDVYPMLQRIETRIFKCRDRIKDLHRNPLPIPPS